MLYTIVRTLYILHENISFIIGSGLSFSKLLQNPKFQCCAENSPMGEKNPEPHASNRIFKTLLLNNFNIILIPTLGFPILPYRLITFILITLIGFI
jgi:hypothetical protein